MIKKVVFTIKEGPFSGTSPYAAVKMALSARKRGVEVAVFYYSEGILCLKKDLASRSETFFEYRLKLEALKNAGIKILACRASMELHGMNENELVDGVEVIASITDFILDPETRVLAV